MGLKSWILNKKVGNLEKERITMLKSLSQELKDTEADYRRIIKEADMQTKLNEAKRRVQKVREAINKADEEEEEEDDGGEYDEDTEDNAEGMLMRIIEPMLKQKIGGITNSPSTNTPQQEISKIKQKAIEFLLEKSDAEVLELASKHLV